MRILLFAVAALGAAAQFHQAPQAPKGITRVASVEGITEYRLDNGLRALLFPDPSKPTITVNMTYLVGSRHENYGETGMAHIIEHLVSYGSPRHPDAKKEQNDRGAMRNATTWWDRTNYFEVFPASEENLQWALDLEADRMMNAFVRKDILASQMSVVRNEFEAGENSPPGLLYKRVLGTAFDYHNYGKTTIGSKSDIENVPIERLAEFYKRYYRPDNAVLVIAGRFDETKTLHLISTLFGPLKNPPEPLPRTYTLEDTQDGERSVTLRRVGDVQALMVLYKTPAAAHVDTALLTVAAAILNTPPSGRLYKALVETKKAASVGGAPTLLREPGFLLLNAIVRKDSPIEEARAALLGVLDGIAAAPFTAEETERAKATLLKNIDLSLNESTQVGLSLTEWAAAGDWRLLFINRDRIRKATPAEVQRAALAYLKPTNRTVGLFIPEANPVRAEIPATPDIAALVRDYKGDAALAQGEAFDPSSANIEKRTVRTKLANGLTLVLLPKKTRGATVNAAIRLNYGDVSSLKGRSMAANLMNQILMRGTTKRTRQQIQDELNRLKAQMNVFGDGPSTILTIQTIAANLPEVLNLATEVLREPSFPQAEFDQVLNAFLASQEQARQTPEVLAQIALLRHLNPYPEDDPRYVMTLDERIASARKVGLADVKKFYAEFLGAADAQVAVVGDFSPAETQKLVAERLGSWQGSSKYVRMPREYRPLAAANASIETPDKANAMFTAAMLFKLSDTDPDYPAIALANYMLGGHSTSRLYNRIRAKEGLSYSVASNIAADGTNTRAQWMMIAITNPVNIHKVEAAFRDEVERAVKAGFDAQEVEAAKKGWLQSRNVQRSQDAALAMRLIGHAHEKRTVAYEDELEKKVAALTVDEVNAALRRHLNPAMISVFRAGDFRKAAAAPAAQ